MSAERYSWHTYWCDKHVRAAWLVDIARNSLDVHCPCSRLFSVPTVTMLHHFHPCTLVPRFPFSPFQRPRFFHCASVYVIVYQMWCCQCVSSQLDTYIAEVLAGVTLSDNAFECWHARGPSSLARLVKDLTCATASQACVERISSACGLLYSERRRAIFRCLEMSVCLKLRQCWKKRLIHGNRLSKTMIQT